MSTQEIERLIGELQKGQQELARRDREHDEHITILLGQVVTLLPEVRELKDQIQINQATVNERFDRLDARIDGIVGQLAIILQKLDEGKS